MSDKIKLWCWVQGDEVNCVFDIQIKLNDTISTLKRLIREENPSFQSIATGTLKPRKFGLSLASMGDDSAHLIKLKDGEPLKGWKGISDYWTEQPAKGILSVILPRPAGTTITPPSSNTSNLSEGPPPWLVEIHHKLWGRRDLFDQIFRTINLTKTDFIELQAQLHSLDPSRGSESHVAMNVLAIKLDFLRSRSFTSIGAAAHFSKYDAAKLVPKLDVDKSKDFTPITADVTGADDDDVDTDDDDVDTDAMDADIVDTNPLHVGPEPEPNSPSHYAPDAAFLSQGSAAVLPCTIRFMDLTALKLEHLIRVPHVMLIRDDWRAMVDIFNRRRKGILGSAIFTGQPGIGKTCLLFHILFLCIIQAQPIVFQDKGGAVFFIGDEVRHEKGRVVVPGDDVLTLVDADGESCIPNQFLLDAANLRVLLISSPRTRDDRKWLTQDVKETEAVFVAEPWSREELLVMSLFLVDVDITLKRFKDITRICGYIPRQCVAAALSPDALSSAISVILTAINETEKLADTIAKVHNGKPIHHAFEIYPSPESRRWINCLIRPVSDWAFSQMMAELDRRGADAVYHF